MHISADIIHKELCISRGGQKRYESGVYLPLAKELAEEFRHMSDEQLNVPYVEFAERYIHPRAFDPPG